MILPHLRLMSNIKKFFSKCAATVSNDKFVGRQFDVQNETVEATVQIGQGSFAYVYETTNPNYVIKYMKIQTSEQLSEVFQEIYFQQLISNHQNIAKLYASYINHNLLPKGAKYEQYKNQQLPCECSLILERCETSVLTILNKMQGFLQEDQVIQIFAGVVAGFTTQHNQQIINRDGKIENLLFKRASQPFSYKNVRICDFGSCTHKTYTDPMQLIKSSSLRGQLENEIQNKTTPQYRAPEMIDLFARLPITTKSDIFALGVMLYRLMYKVLPFPEGEILANFNIRYQFPDETEEFKKRSKYDEKDDVPIYSEFLKQLIKKCLVKNPNQRASIYELAQILEQKIGKFGAEEEKKVEIKEASEQSQVSQPSTQIKQGLTNMFEWAPVSGQTTPSVQESANSLSLNSGPMIVQQNQQKPDAQLNWGPQNPTKPIVSNTSYTSISVPESINQAKTDLFEWAPSPPQIQSNNTQKPNAISSLDFQPVSQPQQAQYVEQIQQKTVQGRQVEHQQSNAQQNQAQRLLDFQPVQQNNEIEILQQNQQNVQQNVQQTNTIDDLLDFVAPQAAPQVQQQVQQQQQAQQQQQQAQQPLQQQQIYDLEIKQLDDLTKQSSIGPDFALLTTRRVACAIFNQLNLQENKLRERYQAVIYLVKLSLQNHIKLSQVQQLDTNYQMLVQQIQQSQNQNKESILTILRDLFTLQQIAVQYCKLNDNFIQFDNHFKFNQDSAKQNIQTIIKLVQLFGGLCNLSKKSQYLNQYQTNIVQLIAKPILRTVKILSDFSFGLDNSSLHQLKQQYQQITQYNKTFNVQIPDSLELGDF